MCYRRLLKIASRATCSARRQRRVLGGPATQPRSRFFVPAPAMRLDRKLARQPASCAAHSNGAAFWPRLEALLTKSLDLQANQSVTGSPHRSPLRFMHAKDSTMHSEDITDATKDILLGFGRVNRSGLAALREVNDWQRIAKLEIERRTTSIVKSLDDDTLRVIAAGTLDMRALLGEVAQDLAQPR